jgi:hypothetical protein
VDIVIPKGVIISRRLGALERAHEVFATTGTAAITEALGLDADRNKFPTIIVILIICARFMIGWTFKYK